MLDNALFDKHGGRTRYQQVGVQPFDAAIRFLGQVESSGAFTILAQSYEDEFWAHFGEATGAGSSPEGKAAAAAGSASLGTGLVPDGHCPQEFRRRVVLDVLFGRAELTLARVMPLLEILVVREYSGSTNWIEARHAG